ncbi:MAG: hypothetical protein ACK5M3_15540 [Dysgonomonas sp.]
MGTNANRMNESRKPEEIQAEKIIKMIIQDAKAAFPNYTDEQIWDFALLVIRKAIKKLKSTPNQLNFDF